MICNGCPRNCGIDREIAKGFCGSGENIRISRAAPHFWEEPCISGTKGSGTVFFSGCNLRCVFCQNAEISRNGEHGTEVDEKKLAAIFDELKSMGVHNINLVTPTHFADKILKAMEISSPLPFVYNSGGYESTDTIKKFDKKINIWLPDFKYADPYLAYEFSAAKDYPQIALSAILQMYKQAGRYVIENDGLMKSGVIIRHLILPGHLENTKAVIDTICDNFPKNSVKISLMSQYTPPKKYIEKYPELNRRLTEEEYGSVIEYALKKGLYDAYIQELSSAKEEYTPPFDYGKQHL